MTLISTLLRINVKYFIRVIFLAEECLVLIFFLDTLVFDFLQLSFCPLLDLIGHRNRHVLLPEFELGLELRVAYHIRKH